MVNGNHLVKGDRRHVSLNQDESFTEIVTELEQCFPNPDEIVLEQNKKDFVKLFGEYLRVENVLQNYDEFVSLKALQKVDINDPTAVETFKAEHYLSEQEQSAIDWDDTELNSTLPKMSPLNPQYKTKKQSVFRKIVAFVEQFKEVGDQI